MNSNISHYKGTAFLFEIDDFLPDDFVTGYIGKIDELVKTQKPFGLVFKYLNGKPRKTRAGNKLENDWLKKHKHELGNYCYGIALLSNPSIFATIQKIVLKGAGEKMMGCKMQLFFEIEQAEAWLNKREMNFQNNG